MANYKSRKAKPRRTSRRHSTSGKILSPLDVRSSNSLGEFKKRIKAGPITIIMVYADWCGHCHEMMPHFKAASVSKGRSAQSIALNDKMMEEANAIIKRDINANVKSITPDGYPSFFAVDNQGNVIATPTPPKSTEVLTKLMTQSGNLAVQAGLSNPVNPNSMNSNVGEARGSIQPGVQPGVKPGSIENDLETSMPMSIVQPGSTESDLEPGSMTDNQETITNLTENNNTSLSTMRGGYRTGGYRTGGSLYASLAQSAYTLAPSAALLATAAYMMNKKSNRHSKKHGKHSRRISHAKSRVTRHKRH